MGKMVDMLEYKLKIAVGRMQAKLPLKPTQFCLILGPPRSGTTALSKWLRKQPGTIGYSETRVLVSLFSFVTDVSKFRKLEDRSDLLLSQARQLLYSYYGSRGLYIGKRLLVDKEPLEPIAFPHGDYLKFIGAIKRLVPRAKFLFVIRDPISTVWSMTQREWGCSINDGKAKKMSLEYHLKSWVDSVTIVPELVNDPDIYICQYHNLVADPTNESERILSFLGINNGFVFTPRPAKTPGFSAEEMSYIYEKTNDSINMLKNLGIKEI